jgi:hypothetical protein
VGAANPLLIRVGIGTLKLASTGTGANGDIAVSNDSTGGLDTNQITGLTTSPAESQRVTIVQTAGDFKIGADIGNATDDFVLQSLAGTIDGSGTVSAHNLLLDANQGIGIGGAPVLTQVDGLLAARVTAVSTGGGISILETTAGGYLTIGTFAGVVGVSAANGQPVELKTDGGRLVINSAVTTVGPGAVVLKSAGTTSEVAINALIKTVTGPNRVQSERDITVLKAAEGVAEDPDDVEQAAVEQANRDALLWAFQQTPGGPMITADAMRRALKSRAKRTNPQTFGRLEDITYLHESLAGIRDSLVNWLRALGGDPKIIFGELGGPEPVSTPDKRMVAA